MELREIISVNTDVLGGQTVFKGTRVPVETLFDHLEAGVSLDSFLEDFPTVTREKAVALLDFASKMLNTKNLETLYAAVA